MFRRLVAVALGATVVTACLPGGFDWMFVVQNNTEHDIYLRAKLSTDRGETSHRVARVPAGASGRSVEWYGRPNNPIEILDSECGRLGVFSPNDDPSTVLTVASVPGLSGHVERYHFQNINDNAPIEHTQECGGFIYM